MLRLRTLTLLLLAAPIGVPANATHLAFSSDVDRFEVQGTSLGSFVDEFDDGVLTPWVVDDGTATEAGGLATLGAPGIAFSITDGVSLDIAFDRSDIGLNDVAWDGYGDAVISSTWVSQVPDEGELFFQNIQPALASDSLANTILAVVDFNAAQAALLGLSPGLQVLQWRNIDQPIGTIVPGSVLLESYPILASSITGDIVLRASFDDATDTITHAFSLDGGTTFTAPFSALQVDGGAGRLVLTAGTVPEPGTMPLVLVGLAWLGTRGRRVRS